MLGIKKDISDIIKAIKETEPYEWDLILVLLMGVLILIPIAKVSLAIGVLWFAYQVKGTTCAVCILCGMVISDLISSRKH